MTGIREDVEKRLYDLLSDLGERIGTERIEQFFEGAITSAARTKKVVDRNVESLLSLANIPSRRDYERMRAKLDALQGSIMNLTRTVEDLRQQLAGTNGTFTHETKSSKPKAPRTTGAKRPGGTRGER